MNRGQFTYNLFKLHRRLRASTLSRTAVVWLCSAVAKSRFKWDCWSRFLCFFHLIYTFRKTKLTLSDITTNHTTQSKPDQ